MSVFRYTLKQVQTQNDFLVRVSDADWKQEWIELISNQTISAKVNLAYRRVELEVRQLRTGHIQDLIFHILKGTADERLIGEIRVRPAKRQAYEYVFNKGHLIDHNMKFDIYSREPLVHRLVFEFDEVVLHSKEPHAIEANVHLNDKI